MSNNSTRFHSKALSSASLVIVNSDNVSALTLIVASGTCTIKGNMPFQNSDTNDDLTLTAGQTWSLPSKGAGASLDGITITAIGGITNIAILF